VGVSMRTPSSFFHPLITSLSSHTSLSFTFVRRRVGPTDGDAEVAKVFLARLGGDALSCGGGGEERDGEGGEEGG
jgi:hypothetical protein